MIEKLKDWCPPKGWIEIHTIDVHTGGEPLRIILSGFPRLSGNTIQEKRIDARSHFDKIRKALMWEPRGHTDMYGAIIVEPHSHDADFGVVFIHNNGYSTGCGHAVIALTKVVVETGLISKNEPITEVKMDVPSGFVQAYAELDNGKIRSVGFQNVPSFVQLIDHEINVPELGILRYDLAYGGAFYVFVDVAQLGLKCDSKYLNQLIDAGMKIKESISRSVKMKHPNDPEMNFIYGTIFTGEALNRENHSRNVCIFANGQVDRSPTGTGVSARAAIMHAKGDLKIGESITIESIIGSTFSVKLIASTKFGNYNAVVAKVSGNAFITGSHRFWLDPDDPLQSGFLLK